MIDTWITALEGYAAQAEGEEGKDEFDGNIFSDENHLHFGKGQTETTLELQPGIHTIQLVFDGPAPDNEPLTLAGAEQGHLATTFQGVTGNVEFDQLGSRLLK